MPASIARLLQGIHMPPADMLVDPPNMDDFSITIVLDPLSWARIAEIRPPAPDPTTTVSVEWTADESIKPRSLYPIDAPLQVCDSNLCELIAY